MAQPSKWGPSLKSAVKATHIWVSPRPVTVSRVDGSFERGFWFVENLFSLEQAFTVPWEPPKEPSKEYTQRWNAFKASASRGVLATFISTDRLIERTYNAEIGAANDVGPDKNRNKPRRFHVQLYAAKQPTAATLFNVGSKEPVNPRHRRTFLMPWYGRRWSLVVTSTPLFEQDSPRYRARVIAWAGSALTLLAAALVGVSLRARGQQERMTADVIEARDALAASEKERERLGHDLHDGAIQSLYAIQLGLSRTGESVAATLPGASEMLEETRHRLDDVIAELRRFILARQEPSENDTHVGLDTVLAAMVQRLQPTTQTRLTFEAEPNAANTLSTSQVVQLTQIARTALANCLRHAQAKAVKISLRNGGEFVRLQIADDGAGFDLKELASGGLGLKTMRARAADAGGDVVIESKPGAGTRILVSVPVGKHE